MFKNVLLGAGLLALSSAASAKLIVSESAITGADMAGMEVTVTYDNGNTDTGIWQMITNTTGTTGNATVDAEGRSGGVIKDTWSLTQQGFTLGGAGSGQYANQLFGLWTFTNKGPFVVSSVSINGWMAGATKIAFDIVDTAEVTPGSMSGQTFVSDSPDSSGTYSNQVNVSYNDLFYKLTINFEPDLNQSETVRFFADTEKLTQVPEPGVLALMLCGLALVARRSLKAS